MLKTDNKMASKANVEQITNLITYGSTEISTANDNGYKKKPPIHSVNECLQQKAIDIYQFLAIHHNPNHEDICKGLICIYAQIIGISLIIYEVVTSGRETRDFCNYDYSPLQILYKILAFTLCVVMSYRGTHLLFNGKGIHKLEGGYRNGVSSICWAWIGWSVNRLVALGVIGGGYLVIFFAATTWVM
eukprot:733562_1